MVGDWNKLILSLFGCWKIINLLVSVEGYISRVVLRRSMRVLVSFFDLVMDGLVNFMRNLLIWKFGL